MLDLEVLESTFPAVAAFAERLPSVVQATLEPDAPKRPSEDACRWCKLRRECTARTEAALSGVPTISPDITISVTNEAFTPADVLVDPGTLSPEEIVRVLDTIPFIRSTLSGIEDYAKDLLKTRRAPPALAASRKLIQGTAHRKWVGESEDSTLKALQAIRWKDPLTDKTTGLKKRDLTETKLRSPSQVENEFKRLAKQGLIQKTHLEAFERLVEKPVGALKMVPITDDRPSAIPSTIEEMFGVPETAPEPPPIYQ